MTAIEKIKARINQLFKENNAIHITITLSHPRIYLSDTPVIISGVYPHVFRVEEFGVENPKSYTLQYTDLLTNSVSIKEL